MITELAEATAGLLRLIDDYYNKSGSREIEAATERASEDVEHFKDELLARDLDGVNLRLAGLQHGILVRVTDAECEQLRAVAPRLDGFALLGLYARARAADLAAECGEVAGAGR